jgi:hypothetical protein
MPRSLIWLFSIASGLSVANVYYAQPLLDAGSGFRYQPCGVGGVVTATQLGCALACFCWFRWVTKWIDGI